MTKYNPDRFLPDQYLRHVLPDGFWSKKILGRNLDPKLVFLRAIVRSTVVTGRKLDETYQHAIDFYDNKMDKLKDEGFRKYKSMALHDERLLKSRIANLVIYEEMQHQKEKHKGQRYRWLPSSAKEPEPEHQLLYGKIFNYGEGDADGNMPAERYGCQCGIEWLD